MDKENLIRWLEGEKYIIPETVVTEVEEKKYAYQLGSNRTIEKIIKFVEDNWNTDYIYDCIDEVDDE